MPTKPLIMHMETEDTATGSAWTASSLKNFGTIFPIEPCSCIYALLKATAVTDAATHEQAVTELLNGLEVDLAGFGIVHRSFGGKDWLALLRALYGAKSLAYRGAQANDAWGTLPIPIPFGFPFGSEVMAAPPKARGSWTGWTKMGTSSHLDGLHLAYVADIIKGATPSEILTSDYLSVTAVAAEADQVAFIRQGKLIGILLYDTTAYDTTSLRLLVDGVGIDFDSYIFAEQARNYLKKYGGDWAGGEETASDCDAEHYTWISLGEDPAAWPDVSGKQVTVRATCATAEAKRFIPVMARTVA